jgi:hypothetical protein
MIPVSKIGMNIIRAKFFKKISLMHDHFTASVEQATFMLTYGPQKCTKPLAVASRNAFSCEFIDLYPLKLKWCNCREDREQYQSNQKEKSRRPYHMRKMDCCSVKLKNLIHSPELQEPEG